MYNLSQVVDQTNSEMVDAVFFVGDAIDAPRESIKDRVEPLRYAAHCYYFKQNIYSTLKMRLLCAVFFFFFFDYLFVSTQDNLLICFVQSETSANF